jgi:ADP-ribose pyrophosphatase YjhB (NUDIX family)
MGWTDLTPGALAARYDEPYRKSDRIELSAERFERGLQRGDDGTWGVGALVVDDGRVLFVREGDTWLLPGGRLEAYESPATGAAREVGEETGVSVEIVDLLAIAEQTFVNRGTEETYEFYFATFLGKPSTSPTPSPTPADDSIDEVAWLTTVPENTFDRGLVVRLVDTHV